MTKDPYRSHAALIPSDRRLKAEKIRRLVGQTKSWQGARVLDVGTGAGIIAQELSRAVGSSGELHSVDVVDERIARDGFEFHQVEDATLPFRADFFDIVVSNHAIEHVGGEAAQRGHLAEVHRVLRSGGVLYLATPSRWVLVEPHYRLPFLSWLPRPAADIYLRLRRERADYDCFLLTKTRLRRFLTDAGFTWDEPVVEAMRMVADIEHPSGLSRLVLRAPKAVLRPILPVIPTIICLARKEEERAPFTAGRGSTPYRTT